MATVVRRRPPGKNGGRPVNRDFWFVKADDGRYPSESVYLRTNREPPDPNQQPSWSWALAHLELEDLWMVVAVDQTKDNMRNAINSARASIWRAAMRRGTPIVSQYEAPNLYVKVVKE